MTAKPVHILLLVSKVVSGGSFRPSEAAMWSKVCWIASAVFLVAMVVMSILGRMDMGSVGQIISMMLFILFFWIPCGVYQLYKRFRKQDILDQEVSNYLYQQAGNSPMDSNDRILDFASDRTCPEEDSTLIPQSPAPTYTSRSEGMDLVQLDFDSDPPPPYDDPPPPYEEVIFAMEGETIVERVRQ